MYLRGWVETEDYSLTATIWIWRSLQFPVTSSAGHILGCLLGLLRSTLGWILLSNNNNLNTKMSHLGLLVGKVEGVRRALGWSFQLLQCPSCLLNYLCKYLPELAMCWQGWGVRSALSVERTVKCPRLSLRHAAILLAGSSTSVKLFQHSLRIS